MMWTEKWWDEGSPPHHPTLAPASNGPSAALNGQIPSAALSINGKAPPSSALFVGKAPPTDASTGDTTTPFETSAKGLADLARATLSLNGGLTKKTNGGGEASPDSACYSSHERSLSNGSAEVDAALFRIASGSLLSSSRPPPETNGSNNLTSSASQAPTSQAQVPVPTLSKVTQASTSSFHSSRRSSGNSRMATRKVRGSLPNGKALSGRRLANGKVAPPPEDPYISRSNAVDTEKERHRSLSSNTNGDVSDDAHSTSGISLGKDAALSILIQDDHNGPTGFHAAWNEQQSISSPLANGNWKLSNSTVTPNGISGIVQGGHHNGGSSMGKSPASEFHNFISGDRNSVKSSDPPLTTSTPAPSPPPPTAETPSSSPSSSRVRPDINPAAGSHRRSTSGSTSDGSSWSESSDGASWDSCLRTPPLYDVRDIAASHHGSKQQQQLQQQQSHQLGPLLERTNPVDTSTSPNTSLSNQATAGTVAINQSVNDSNSITAESPAVITPTQVHNQIFHAPTASMVSPHHSPQQPSTASPATLPLRQGQASKPAMALQSKGKAKELKPNIATNGGSQKQTDTPVAAAAQTSCQDEKAGEGVSNEGGSPAGQWKGPVPLVNGHAGRKKAYTLQTPEQGPDSGGSVVLYEYERYRPPGPEDGTYLHPYFTYLTADHSLESQRLSQGGRRARGGGSGGEHDNDLDEDDDDDLEDRVSIITIAVLCVMGVAFVVGVFFLIYSSSSVKADYDTGDKDSVDLMNAVYQRRIADIITGASREQQQQWDFVISSSEAGAAGAGGQQQKESEPGTAQRHISGARQQRKSPSSTPAMELCPIVPEHLMGNGTEVNLTQPLDIDDILSEHQDVLEGGEWMPEGCMARHRVAFVIPYRDRWSHLKSLLYYLIPILKRQQIHFRMFVVEQYGNDTFNKGRIMNAAFREALKLFDFQCVTFHDVDLVPEDDRNMYSCVEMPKHMSIAIDKFDYHLPYDGLVGGVLMFKTEHFQQVNGYSNMYWGWGAEDDDMTTRILHHGLRIFRPPSNIARYKMVKHDGRKGSEVSVRMKLLRSAARRSKMEGLNNIQYNLLYTHTEKLFTHFLVDIGHP